ncbi:MAG: helix-turn-helix domain-containing protein [Proteobacteria bacterium]|nr:helix-turn-helix domain-containing protein [Pseudomonadota bacterium]
MDIHKRIKQLRLEHEWKQSELAEKLGLQQKQISAYERGASKPSTEALIKLAKIFNVSLDYLVGNLHGHNHSLKVRDKELMRYFEILDQYDDEERTMAKEMLNLLIMKHKFLELSRTTSENLINSK